MINAYNILCKEIPTVHFREYIWDYIRNLFKAKLKKDLDISFTIDEEYYMNNFRTEAYVLLERKERSGRALTQEEMLQIWAKKEIRSLLDTSGSFSSLKGNSHYNYYHKQRVEKEEARDTLKLLIQRELYATKNAQLIQSYPEFAR